mmetsp:Transcript_6516/g.13455  ORF Transcript_6516/g.13455 Transcript_6516/m.13455 type:complete len:80 (-) Transcript_6516:233-472(-)
MATSAVLEREGAQVVPVLQEVPCWPGRASPAAPATEAQSRRQLAVLLRQRRKFWASPQVAVRERRLWAQRPHQEVQQQG